MNRLACTIIGILIGIPVLSQWEEIVLPSVYPENEIIVHGDKHFTFQSPGGVYKSEDDRHTWARAMNGIPPTTAYWDMISFKGALYISTFTEGMFRSVDDGDSWEKVGSEIPNDYQGVYYDFTVHNGKLYTIGYGDQIYVSEDGMEWQQVNDPETWNNNSSEDKTLFSNGGNFLFTIGEGQMYRSEDEGNSWSLIDLEDTLLIIGTLDFIYDLDINDSLIWIASVSKNYDPILIHSLDSGKTWDIQYINSNSRINSVAISDQYAAYTLQENVYYSPDNGQTWNSKFHAPSSKIISLTASDFLISSPTKTSVFNPVNEIFTDFEITGIRSYSFSTVINRADKLIPFTVEDGSLSFIDKMTEKLTDFSTSNYPQPNLGDIAVFGSDLYGLFNSHIYVYNPVDSSWEQSYQHPDDLYFSSLAGSNNRLFANASDGLYVTNGDSNIMDKFNVDNVVAVSVVERDSMVIINGNDKLLISTDHGITWKTKDPDIYAAPYQSTAVSDSRIFTCTINGLFVSDDIGESWDKVTFDLFDDVYSLYYHIKKLYIGTEEGVFVTPDYGSTWFTKTRGQKFFQVNELMADDSLMYANTTGGGIWKILLDSLNSPPTIESFNGPGEFAQNENIVLAIDNLTVTDEDDILDSLDVIIFEGDNYNVNADGSVSVSNQEVSEVTINVKVTDGIYLSNVFGITLSIVTGIKESNNNDLRLYPNPTSSKVYIEKEDFQKTDVVIFDMQGRIIKKLPDNSTNSTLELDLEYLQPGTYIIKVIQEDKNQIIKKVVKI